MRLFEQEALRAAIAFPLAHGRLVLSGAGLYALLFAVQSVMTVWLAAGSASAGLGALVFALVAFAGFAVALAGWTRAALGLEPARLSFGGDELRLIWVALLVLILGFTVLGTALLVLSFMLAALAMIGAQRSGLTEPPEGFINIFALFGPGEWIVAGVLVAGFVFFAVWLFARLAVSVPATIEGGRIRVLSVWPLSSGRFLAITLSAAVIILPAIALLAGFNAVCAAAFGFHPGQAASIINDNGDVTGPVALFAVLAFVYGGLKMILLGAPLTGLFAALYRKYAEENAFRLES